DEGDDSRVEAALDDFAIYSGGGSGAPAAKMTSTEGSAPLAIGRPEPVPSSEGVRASLALSRATTVEAGVFDVRGRLVRSIRSGMFPAGSHELLWDGRRNDGSRASSGVYWLRIRAGQEERSLKLIIAR